MVYKCSSRDNKGEIVERGSISLVNINRCFSNKKIFENLNLEIKNNTIYSLIGHNGAGKTTLIRIILGLLKYESGKVEISGTVGSLLENDYLYENLTAKENISIFSKYFKIDENKKNSAINKYINKLSLDQHLDKKIHTFSKGMKRKFSLIITLLKDPDILILDEPTSGVDPESRIEIRDLLNDLKEQGKTILITSHDLSEIEKVSDTVSIIKNGEIATTIERKELSNMNKYVVKGYKKDDEIMIKSILSEYGIVFVKECYIELISSNKIEFIKLELDNYRCNEISKTNTNLEEIYLNITNS